MLKKVNEFYEFLTGYNVPEGTFKSPKLSKNKAFAIIYYLQDHLPIFPNTIEKCCKCGDLFDINQEGGIDKKGEHYCGSCIGQIKNN